ncbi:MAG: hypothetical protein AAGG75_14030, partial [Bacteroidota bacterium]
MSKKIYTSFTIKYEQTTHWLIYITDEVDAVLTNPANQLLLFDTLDNLKSYASKHNILIEKGEAEINLDALKTWLNDPTLPMDYNNVL